MNAHDPHLAALPRSLDAEQGVLGAVILNNEAYGSVAGFLREEHFDDAVHRATWAAIAARIREGRPASVLTLAGDLPLDDGELSAPAYLAHLAASAVPAVALVGMAKEIVHIAARRRLTAIADALSDMARMPGANAKTVIAEAETEMLVLADELDRLDQSRKGSSPDEILAEIEERMVSGRHWKGPTCGLKAVDDRLGGFAPGDLIILGARPAMGKTASALSIARRAATLGHGVAFVSLEMTAAQLWHRLISDQVEASYGKQVAYSHIGKGDINAAEFALVRRAKDQIKLLPLWITDRGDRLSDLPGHVRNARRWLQKRGKDLEMLVIDYLGLLKPGDRYAGSMVHETGEKSSTVKALAKREGIPIIALHQLNRANVAQGRTNFRPQLSDLRDSGALEQDADVVMFVHREAYYIREGLKKFDDEQAKLDALLTAEHQMEIIVSKQRQGPTGVCELWCNMATNSVRDAAQEAFR